MKITLPFPPSANRYWRTRVAFKGARPYVQTYVSAEAKEYKHEVRLLAMAARQPLLHGRLIVFMDFYRPRKSGDLDNRVKVVLDALQSIVYCDDKQIVELHLRRFDDKNDPRVELRIEEIG